MKKMMCVFVVSTMALSGCVTAPPNANQNNSPTNPSVNAAVTTAMGATIGCVAARLLNKDCATGAVVGGALAIATLVWKATSEKTADATQVNQQARQEGIRVPINEIILKDYKIYPDKTSIVRGNEMFVVGDITLIGQSSRRPEVVQTMILTLPDGTKASDTPQVAKVEKVDGAGKFTATNNYKIAQGMPQGQYSVESKLTLNGREVVANRKTGFQVAYVDGVQTIMMASLN